MNKIEYTIPGAGDQLKRKPGQPKKDNPKIRVTFRLEPHVIEIIKAQENQAKFIEGLVMEFNSRKL